MTRKFINAISAIPSTQTLLRIANPNIVSVFYHTVSSKPLPHIKHLYPALTPQQFAQDLDFMLKHFTPIGINDLISGNKHKKPGLFLSFDDGFSEVYTEVLPILKSKSIPATIFINPHFVDNKDMLYRCKVSLIIEKVNSLQNLPNLPNLPASIQNRSKIELTNWLKSLTQKDMLQIEKLAANLNINFNQYLSTQKPYLTLNQIKELTSQGFSVGAHSLNHPNFAELTAKQQIEQAEQSIEWISKNIPNQPNLFAFPFSSDGVSPEFIAHFLQKPSHKCDMIFGTSGYKPTNSPNFLHRIPMEEKNKKAQQIIKGEMLYYVAKKMINRHKDNMVI